MSWLIIRPQIKELLETIDKIQEVKLAPTLKFGGFPAAYVVPSDQASDYETTVENERTYAFIVRVFYDTKDTPMDAAMTSLEALVDDILDEFDKEDMREVDRTIAKDDLPEGYTFLNIRAHPSAWGELPEQNLLMAEVTCRVRISRDISPGDL